MIYLADGNRRSFSRFAETRQLQFIHCFLRRLFTLKHRYCATHAQICLLSSCDVRTKNRNMPYLEHRKFLGILLNASLPSNMSMQHKSWFKGSLLIWKDVLGQTMTKRIPAVSVCLTRPMSALCWWSSSWKSGTSFLSRRDQATVRTDTWKTLLKKPLMLRLA